MSRKETKYHQEKDSPFFRLRNRKKLMNLLFSSEEKINELTNGSNYYNSFPKTKKSGGVRTIDAPRHDLKIIQKRISDLLLRIEPPSFLFAPVSGRSYVDNAAQHLGSRSLTLLDIEDFFPSCTANRVVWFFQNRMQCSVDIAVILKNLLTKDERLPQGSPCSPILAYLCYVDMWEEIDREVSKACCKLSVYADDITISGEIVPSALIWKVKKLLKKYGHDFKTEKERNIIDKAADITGVS